MENRLRFVALFMALVGILIFVLCSCEGCDALANCEGLLNCEGCDSCNSCEDIFNPTHKHTIAVDEAVPATCTTTGLTEGQHCSECGEVIVPQKLVIPQHNFVQNAETTLFSCSECGATIYNGHLYAIYTGYIA